MLKTLRQLLRKWNKDSEIKLIKKWKYVWGRLRNLVQQRKLMVWVESIRISLKNKSTLWISPSISLKTNVPEIKWFWKTKFKKLPLAYLIIPWVLTICKETTRISLTRARSEQSGIAVPKRAQKEVVKNHNKDQYLATIEKSRNRI